MYIHFVFISHFVQVYSIHSAVWLVTEHVNSMTTTSETGIKWGANNWRKGGQYISKVTATSKDPHKKKIAEECCIS
jgi:hypothetical protein